MHMHKAFKLASFKAADQALGIFEAVVAVFDNVDRAGDMIVKGAFTKTLASWKERGRPIPVIFSHEWDNLDAHIGEVLEAEEVEKGLRIKAQLEMDEPFAQRVYKKMSKGTLAEFSFAYDVVASEEMDRGEGATPRKVNKLTELELLEVGPCLVGMNPETELIGVKRGARHSQKDTAALQKIHDLSVELGAKCLTDGQSEDEDADQGEADEEGSKHRGPGSSTLAARVRLELVELES